MVDFATDWLASLFGAEVKRAIGRKKATRWNSEPYRARRLVGGRAGRAVRASRNCSDPIADGVWYAGEAAHETLWGTVGGAWESGERAADAVLRQLGPIKPRAAAEAEPPNPTSSANRRAARREPAPRRADLAVLYRHADIMREER